MDDDFVDGIFDVDCVTANLPRCQIRKRLDGCEATFKSQSRCLLPVSCSINGCERINGLSDHSCLSMRNQRRDLGPSILLQ